MKSTVDRSGIAELARTPAMWKLLEPAALAVESTAKRIAPTGATRNYKEKMFRRRASDPRFKGWWVGSDDFKAWWIEFGSNTRPKPHQAHHVFIRAARLNGLRVTRIAKPT